MNLSTVLASLTFVARGYQLCYGLRGGIVLKSSQVNKYRFQYRINSLNVSLSVLSREGTHLKHSSG